MNTKKALFLAVSACLFASCTQKMAFQGRGNPALVRRPPEGTIARGQLAQTTPPSRITRALLEEGRTRFNIHCTPCHGYAGYGDGIIRQRGFLPPPSYHIARLRDAPDSHFYDVMTHGFGAMYSYADHLSESERWAVVAYIRALQLSQNPKPGKLTPEEKRKIEEGDHS